MSAISCDEANMEALRRQAASAFGVTVVGRDMTLRMKGPGGEHLEFSFVLVAASDSSVRSCHMCGTRLRGKSHVARTKIENCGGWEETAKMELCYK